jgi:hypothetical protein
VSRQLIKYLAFALSFLPASLAVAEAPIAEASAVYETVDAVEVWGNRITVTGIVSGQSAPSELQYLMLDLGTTSGGLADSAARCDRLALLAMAKPGKYQFAMVRVEPSSRRFGCKLIVRTP